MILASSFWSLLHLPCRFIDCIVKAVLQRDNKIETMNRLLQTEIEKNSYATIAMIRAYFAAKRLLRNTLMM